MQRGEQEGWGLGRGVEEPDRLHWPSQDISFVPVSPYADGFNHTSDPRQFTSFSEENYQDLRTQTELNKAVTRNSADMRTWWFSYRGLSCDSLVKQFISFRTEHRNVLYFNSNACLWGQRTVRTLLGSENTERAFAVTQVWQLKEYSRAEPIPNRRVRGPGFRRRNSGKPPFVFWSPDISCSIRWRGDGL